MLYTTMEYKFRVTKMNMHLISDYRKYNMLINTIAI